LAAARSNARPSALGAALGGALVALLAVVYPWALEAVLRRVGTRGLALLLLGATAVSLPLRRARAGGGLAATAGMAGLLAVAAASGDARVLRLVPAWIYVALAALFAASLRGPGSILERAARWLVPEAPGFIRGYCRAVTAAWVAVFFANAAIVVWLALAGHPDAWRRFTSRDVWLAMGAFSAGEFLVRKTWFRYYFHGGPFERFWSSLFPAERTARGRRSLEYIAAYRAELAPKASPERAE
jgi:uncharacterized membrane protein